MRKAQIQAISLVLITGIVISLAGIAYMWGRPLIEKRSAVTDTSTAESFIIQLDSEIIDVARNRGVKILDIPTLPDAILNLTSSENALYFEYSTTQPMLSLGNETAPVPIETSHIEPVGSYGESPRIITLESAPAQYGFLMRLKLKYRELFTDSEPRRGYKIEILPADSARIRGRERVTVSYEGTEAEFDPEEQADVQKTLISVRIS